MQLGFPKQEIRKMPFLRPKNGLLGGPPRTHLNNLLGILNCFPLARFTTGRGELNTPRRLFKWVQGDPPKVHFLVSKMAFSGFPVSGLCRGSGGLQNWVCYSPGLFSHGAPDISLKSRFFSRNFAEFSV